MMKELISQSEEGWSWGRSWHVAPLGGCAIPIPCDFSAHFCHSHPQGGRGDGGGCCAMESGRRKWSWVLGWLFVHTVSEAVVCMAPPEVAVECCRMELVGAEPSPALQGSQGPGHAAFSVPGVIERAAVCQLTWERQEEMASSCTPGQV